MKEQLSISILFSTILSSLLILSECSLISPQDILAPKRNQTNNTINSAHVVETHLIGTSLPSVYNINTFSLQIYYPANASFPSKYFTLNTTITSPTHKVRSFRTNTYYLQANTLSFWVHGIFLQIQNGRVSVGFNTLTQPIVIYDQLLNKSSSTAPHSNIYSQIIEDCYFLTTYNQVVLIIKTSAGYVLKYVYLSIINWSSITVAMTTDVLLPQTQVSLNNSEVYCRKMEHNRLSNKMFLIFSRRFLCYSADYLLQYCGSWLMDRYYDWSELDISISLANTDLVALVYGSHIYIVNATKFESVSMWAPIFYTQSYNAQSIKLQPPYIFIGISWFSVLYYIQIKQIDFTISYDSTTGMYLGQEIDVVIVNNFDKDGQLCMLVNSQIVSYHKFMYDSIRVAYEVIQIFIVTSQYGCSGCVCHPTYTYISSSNTCIKDPITLPMSLQVIPILPPGYSSNPGLTPASQQQVQLNQLQLLLQAIDNSQTLNRFLQVLGKVLPFTLILITPKLFSQLIMILDDLWYYKYHEMVYPDSAQLLMNKADAINIFRRLIFYNSSSSISANATDSDMQTQYLLFIQQGQFNGSLDWMKISISANHNKLYYIAHFKEGRNYHTVPDYIYFINSNLNIYTNQLLFNFLCYLLLKILQGLVYICSKKLKIKKMWLFKYIRDSTKIWVLAIAFIDANMVQIVFNCFIQIKLLFCFGLMNKANHMFTIIFLYVALIYSLLFYVIAIKPNTKAKNIKKRKNLGGCDQRRKKRCSDSPEVILLISPSSPNYKPYIYESLRNVSRNFLHSLIHLYFLSNYKVQICLLTAIDVYSILLTLIHCKYIKSKLIFLLTLIYYSLFLAFDCFFVLGQFYKDNGYFNKHEQQFSFIVLCTILAVAIAILVINFIVWIYGCCLIIMKRYKQWNSPKREKISKPLKKTHFLKVKIIGCLNQQFKERNRKDKNIQKITKIQKQQQKQQARRKIKKCFGDSQKKKNRIQLRFKFPND